MTAPKEGPGVGRGEVSWATLAHELDRLSREPAPAWLSPEAEIGRAHV